MPAVIIASATDSPYTKPEQTADRSNAAARSPSRDATRGAVAGQRRSGVVVARRTRSQSSRPADFSAAAPAVAARSPVEVPADTR